MWKRIEKQASEYDQLSLTIVLLLWSMICGVFFVGGIESILKLTTQDILVGINLIIVAVGIGGMGFWYLFLREDK